MMEARTYKGEDLSYLVVEPDGFEPDQEYPAIFLLHGYGSNMRDLAGLSPSIGRERHIYICPNAPIKMELAPGVSSYAWMELGAGGAGTAVTILSTLLDKVSEQYRLMPGKSVLGGFSQGGMLAFEFGLPRADIFAGLVSLSGRMIDPAGIRSSLPEGRDQSVFIAHGTRDGMISVDQGRESRDFLIGEGYDPEYHEYDMAHEVTQDVLDDLVPWIGRVTETDR